MLNVIKTYLDDFASNNPDFAKKYNDDTRKKSMEECCEFIISQAKKGGKNGYTDQEVFGWAVHYFDEEEIDFTKGISAKVITNHHAELTQEEKDKIMEKAKQEYHEKCMELLQNKSVRSQRNTKPVKPETTIEEPNLFEL